MSNDAGSAARHFFSVDVEDYFHANALESAVGRTPWEQLESRVEGNTRRLLELCERHGVTGTFFTLGWVAERFPGLVREIVEGGHEVASHGYMHRKVTTQSPAQFRDDVRRARVLLEQVGGCRVSGYRAPSFSIVPGGEWAFDVLLEEGYEYDSSVFPIRRPGYGYPGAPRAPYRIQRPSGALLEIPLATLTLGSLHLPAAGGAYLRHLPYGLVAGAARDAAARQVPGMFYIHPWEIDEGQPRLDVGMVTRLRHYGGLARTMSRLDRLFREFRFEPVAAWRARAHAAAESAPLVAHGS